MPDVTAAIGSCVSRSGAGKTSSGPFSSGPYAPTCRTICATWRSSGASTKSPTASSLWSICVTGPCWRRTASRATIISPSPSMMTPCARSCCGSRISPPPWNRRWRTTSLSSTSSPSTGPVTAGSAARRRWCAGFTRSGALCPPASLFPCLKRTALSPSWISTSGSEPVPISVSGRTRDILRCLFLSTCPGRTCSSLIWRTAWRT